MTSVSDRVENIKAKGGNAGYQHFLLFPQCFQKVYFPGSLQLGTTCILEKVDVSFPLTLSERNPGFYMSAVQVF